MECHYWESVTIKGSDLQPGMIVREPASIVVCIAIKKGADIRLATLHGGNMNDKTVTAHDSFVVLKPTSINDSGQVVFTDQVAQK